MARPVRRFFVLVDIGEHFLHGISPKEITRAISVAPRLVGVRMPALAGAARTARLWPLPDKAQATRKGTGAGSEDMRSVSFPCDDRRVGTAEPCRHRHD